jgi:hypothetical protein
MKSGLLLIGGAVVITGFVGLALLSVAANGASSSLGVLANCVPTLPPDEEEDGETNSGEQSSQT